MKETKEFCKKKIIEMVEKIEKQDILNYIYIIVLDIAEEDKKDESKTKNIN